MFTAKHWQELREHGERVWLFRLASTDDSDARRAHTTHGESLHVNEAYKCQIRSPWWRPPVAAPPDLFFTYMSRNHPRLITNTAKVGFLNSMHSIRLHVDVSTDAAAALPPAGRIRYRWHGAGGAK